MHFYCSYSITSAFLAARKHSEQTSLSHSVRALLNTSDCFVKQIQQCVLQQYRHHEKQDMYTAYCSSNYEIQTSTANRSWDIPFKTKKLETVQKFWVIENGLKCSETHNDAIFLCQANYGFQLLTFPFKIPKSVFQSRTNLKNLIFWERADIKTPQQHENSFNISLSANQCCRSTQLK